MKRFLTLLVLMASITLPRVIFAQQPAHFLSSITEMPLMPGLVEEPDTAVIFDGPSGRIIEALAFGNVMVDEIRTFYETVLPQLGWVVLENGNYRQGAEVLQLEFILDLANPAKRGVRFVLRPQGAN